MERGENERDVVVPLESDFFPSSYLVCQQLASFADEEQYTDRGGDGAVVSGGTLGSEVDTVGGLQLDLKGGCVAMISGLPGDSIDAPNLRQCGRSPC